MRVRVGRLVLLALVLLLPSLRPAPARATFHLNEFSKVLAGLDGDTSIQAIEMTMLANGENLVNGKSIKVYDAAGVLVATLGTFSADLPLANAVAGNHILFATMKFKQHFGITPDLQITAGIPATTGQISFEAPTCLVDAVAYGGVTSFLVGSSAAPPLPTSGAAILASTFDLATTPICPLGDNSGQRFVLFTAGGNHPLTFTNNSGQSVSVGTTSTGVEAEVSAAPRFRISPNPVRASAAIESPSDREIRVYDLQGRRVRTIRMSAGAGSAHTTWDATDDAGRPLASGVYFIRQDGTGSAGVRRIVIAR